MMKMKCCEYSTRSRLVNKPFILHMLISNFSNLFRVSIVAKVRRRLEAHLRADHADEGLLAVGCSEQDVGQPAKQHVLLGLGIRTRNLAVFGEKQQW
jgi:hypothetical protein